MLAHLGKGGAAAREEPGRGRDVGRDEGRNTVAARPRGGVREADSRAREEHRTAARPEGAEASSGPALAARNRGGQGR